MSDCHTTRDLGQLVHCPGSGVVTLDGSPVAVGAGVAIDVELGVPHRIENTGNDELVFMEIQHGDYFGEDDIVRLEDDFRRTQ